MTQPPGDTADLRTGAPLHDSLLALLPLVGRWSGSGVGSKPGTGEPFSYFQQVNFVHDGRPFLVYSSATWLVDGGGAVIRPAARESGFWRPGAGPDEVEVVLALNTGLTLVLAGFAGDQVWELASAAVNSTPTAKEVDAERRLYAVIAGAEAGDTLNYAQELAPAGRPLAPHLNARLERIASS
jgi:THAP4-like, heme-binding beta-barrel domain